MFEAGWLIPLDHRKMPNFEQVRRPLVKNPVYDPGNKYTMAWQSGLHRHRLQHRRSSRTSPTSFGDLLDPEVQGPRRHDVATRPGPRRARAARAIGVDPDKSTPDAVETGGRQVITGPADDGIVRNYYDQSYINALENGDTVITQAWSGDIFQRQPVQGYDEPRDEVRLPAGGRRCSGHDNMCIPLYAENPVDAMTYMDYVYDPAVAGRSRTTTTTSAPCPRRRTS